MKRDMDLVRAILLACESAVHGFAPRRLEVKGYDAEQVGFHVYLMIQANLIEGAEVTTNDSTSPEAIATTITWSGYEFLEASKDDERWAKAKGIANKAGGVTIEIMRKVLSDLAAAAAKHAMGLP